MPALLGREQELAILQSQLMRTLETGESSVVMIRGEPGIGKSTLLKTFAASVPTIAADRPVLVGYGQSMTHSLGSDAFQAVRECLRSLVASAARSSSRDALDRVVHAMRIHAPDWLESVPMIGGLLAAGIRTGVTFAENGPPMVNLSSHLDQLTALVTDLFASGPVVLILDDLHWADSATIDIVMALALKVEGPLMLVIAYRPDDLRAAPSGEPHPLIRAVFRLRRYRASCVELDLPRLSERDTRSLIFNVTSGQVIPDDQLQVMIRRSGGIPLYAESLALVRQRPEDPHSDRESRPRRQENLPREISAVIEERLSFAAPEDQRLLEIAVVVGFSFEVQFVATLARTDLDEIYDRLDRLMREHHLIVETAPFGDHDRYAFYHPMLADVLRRKAAANSARWRRYHQRLVDILLTQDVSDEIAVRAAGAAVVALDPRSPALASDAAHRQYRAGAVSQARELAKAAMAAGSGPSYVDAAELLARSLSAEANHHAAAEICAVVLAGIGHGDVQDTLDRDTVDPARVRTLTLLQVRNLRMINNWSAAEDLLHDLETRLSEADLAADRDCRAEILMLRAETHLCGPQQDTAACISLCDRVIELSEDGELVSRAFGHRGLAHLAAYEPDNAERWLRSAIDAARCHGHPYGEYEALHWLSKKKLACLELDDAAILLEQLASTSEASGVASDSPFHRRDTSRLHALRGDVEAAAVSFTQFFELAPPHEHDRALTVLACQVHELEDWFDWRIADRLLRTVEACIGSFVSSPDLQASLTHAVECLQRRPDPWEVCTFVVDVLSLDLPQVQAAEAIFRFDVPDLARLRRDLGHLPRQQR